MSSAATALQNPARLNTTLPMKGLRLCACLATLLLVAGCATSRPGPHYAWETDQQTHSGSQIDWDGLISSLISALVSIH